MQILTRRVRWWFRRSLLLCASAAWVCTLLRAQEVSLRTPRAVASRYLNAVTTGDWQTVIRLTDDASLHEYARGLRRVYRLWPQQVPGTPTVASMMAHDSLMPRAVAEYQVGYLARMYRQAVPDLLGFFADVERASQVDSLDDRELYVRRLRAKQAGYQDMLGYRRAGCTGAAASRAAPEPTRTVRGVAVLSDSEAVALYVEQSATSGRSRVGDGLEHLALQRTKVGWRVTASEFLLDDGRQIHTSMIDCGPH